MCSYKRIESKGVYAEKPAYFFEVYTYLASILETYENEIKKGNNVDIRVKEAVLFIIQRLSNQIESYN